jgi:peptidoglycan/LPS O-acetylase OafA/YrhL
MITRENNFDLLRLFAALQVFIIHMAGHLKVDLGIFGVVLRYFPGVPIFFTISGFLITMSYCKSKSIKQFFYNRFLRIFPALWMCIFLTVISILCFRGITFHALFSKDVMFYILGNLTILQAAHIPDAIKSWGIGSLNGSLWTIPIEIQFYIFIPMVFFLLKKIPILFKLLFFGICSYTINRILSINVSTKAEVFVYITVVPFLFYFMYGSIVYLLWEKIKKYIENRLFFWMILYFIYITVFGILLKLYTPSYYPNFFEFISSLLLSMMIFSIAFSHNHLSNKLLHGADISYGVYLYHMPVINIVLNSFHNYQSYYIIIIFIVVIFFGCMSWFFIEKPMLLLRRNWNDRKLVA